MDLNEMDNPKETLIIKRIFCKKKRDDHSLLGELVENHSKNLSNDQVRSNFKCNILKLILKTEMEDMEMKSFISGTKPGTSNLPTEPTSTEPTTTEPTTTEPIINEQPSGSGMCLRKNNLTRQGTAMLADLQNQCKMIKPLKRKPGRPPGISNIKKNKANKKFVACPPKITPENVPQCNQLNEDVFSIIDATRADFSVQHKDTHPDQSISMQAAKKEQVATALYQKMAENYSHQQTSAPNQFQFMSPGTVGYRPQLGRGISSDMICLGGDGSFYRPPGNLQNPDNYVENLPPHQEDIIPAFVRTWMHR